MVRNYIKKTDRKLPSPTRIKKGLSLLKAGYSLRTAAEQSGMNYACLNRLNKKKEKQEDTDMNIEEIPNEHLQLSHNSRSVFTSDLESSIADYCREMAMIGYGLTVQKVRELAFETAMENLKINAELKIPDCWEKNKIAGIDWYHGFMKRHPTLSVRTPEGCSLARAAAFNEVTVKTFFDKLEECMRRHPSFADGSRVGNLDETANSTVQNIRKIVSPKGIKQVHKIKTAERGVTVTTCCTVTAHGTVIPPVMIFPRKKFVSAMTINAFPGTLGLANEKGYMTKETFVKVLKHVIKYTAASKENPFLLLVDNVETHLSVEALTIAKDNGLTMLTFPPHCTHKLQPLDLSLFGPFKTFYDDAISSWLLQRPGQSVTIYHIAGFVKTALTKSGTVENITAGFARAGITPFDRNIFKPSDFIMSSVTHKVDPNSNVELLAIVPVQEPAENDTNDSITVDNDTEVILVDQSGSSTSFITPREFKGLPTVKEISQKRKPRRKGKCCIPTDSPEKKEIEDRQRARDEKLKKTEENKRKREEKKNQKATPKTNNKKKRTGAVRSLTFSDSENSDIDGALQPRDNSKTRDTASLPKNSQLPVEEDYVLVLFDSKNNSYSVGKVLKNVDKDGNCDISYYRLLAKSKDKFVLPNVPDLCSVHVNDIKTILPKPSSHTARTRRQQPSIGFDFDFSNIKLG